ncbi:DUF2232 domain-containing protein [Thermodesulfobacteriota bacterium]
MASKVFQGFSVHKEMITNIAGCAGLVIIILLASAVIPIFGPIFRILIPFPFLYYNSKLGVNQGIKVSVIALFLVGLIANLAGQTQVIILCIEFGLMGLIISEIYKREFSFGFTIFWGTAIMLIVGSIFLFVMGISKGMGPLELIRNYFQSNLGENILLYENMGLEQEKVAQLKELSKVISDLISKIYLSLVIIGTGLVVWLNVVLSRPLFQLRGIKYPDFKPLDRWQTPELLVWGVIAAGFSIFFRIDIIRLIAINFLIVMAVIYIFNGFSIVLFFLNKYHVPRWIRFGIYALLIIQQMSMAILAMMGLFDQWIDLRKIHKRAG